MLASEADPANTVKPWLPVPDPTTSWFAFELRLLGDEVPIPTLLDVSHVGAPVLSFAGVTAPAAISAVVTESSGNPPAEMPVMVPEPAIEIGMIYTTTQLEPLGIVTVTPEFTVTGPAVTAFLLVLKV